MPNLYLELTVIGFDAHRVAAHGNGHQMTVAACIGGHEFCMLLQ